MQQQLPNPQSMTKKVQVSKEREKECEMTIDKYIGFETMDKGEILRVQNGSK